jgi:type VI secretion system secreted protein Hcp
MYDAYLQLDGIKGESTDDKHKDWIEILSFDHSMMQPVSATKSSSGGASSGRAQHGDFALTKFVDLSSPKLYDALSTGKHLSKAKLEVCRAGGSQVKFLEISFEQVMISQVHLNSPNGKTSSSGPTADDILPTESLSLNYGKIEWVYTQQKRADGSGGGNVNAKYDLTAGKSS